MREVDKKLQDIIKGRTVGVIARGMSAKALEDRIEELKDYDICWASLNLFTPGEKFILSKINKRLSIVSDCSNLPLRDRFEPTIRRPRFEEYLSRKDDNLLMISETVIADFKITGQYDLFQKYKDKIITIDEVFTDNSFPASVWDAPPNSITLLFAALIAGQAKKVILFGYDGHTGSNLTEANKNALHTYYKKELEEKERIAATGQAEIGSLATDSRDFNRDFPGIFEMYKKIYNNSHIEIINCSPSSIFTPFEKISYDELKGELE